MKNLFVLILIPILFVGFSCSKDSNKDCYSLKSYNTGTDALSRKVKMTFQVLDASNNGVAGLDSTKFNVYENGQAISVEAKASFSAKQIPFAIKTVLLFDISSSVQTQIQQIKDAGNSLIDKKLTNQQIAIYVFDKNTRILQDFTADATLLKAAINSIPSTNLEGSTNLYQAVIDVSTLITTHYGVDYIQDGNILMFTDGRHNADPSLTVDKAREAIVKANVNIFVAALQSPDLSPDPLKTIVSGSPNGKYILATDISKLPDVFTQIQTQITNLANSLYFLTYTSPITSPTAHTNTLKISVKGHCGEVSGTFNSQGFQK